MCACNNVTVYYYHLNEINWGKGVLTQRLDIWIKGNITSTHNITTINNIFFAFFNNSVHKIQVSFHENIYNMNIYNYLWKIKLYVKMVMYLHPGHVCKSLCLHSFQNVLGSSLWKNKFILKYIYIYIYIYFNENIQ